MANILPDREIKRLLGSVLVDVEERYINPNGIELRLGKYVRFYSTGETHTYQDTDGIKPSTRRIPADIPKSKIISSSFGKLDPKKQLREAGYPFDHIGAELVELQGKFEAVSTDVRFLKDHFQKQMDALSTKIGQETQAIYKRLDEFRQTFFEKVEALFDRKFYRIVGVLIGAFTIMGALFTWLQTKNIDTTTLLIIGAIAGAAILAITWLVSHRRK